MSITIGGVTLEEEDLQDGFSAETIFSTPGSRGKGGLSVGRFVGCSIGRSVGRTAVGKTGRKMLSKVSISVYNFPWSLF